MQKINVNGYDIRIKPAPSYGPDSSDNKYYDSVLNLVGNGEFTKTVSIEAENELCTKEAALIVPYYTCTDRCAVPAGEYLFLMLDELICLFDPAELRIVKQAELNSFGTMFAAYPYGEDFILYGELEICRVTRDLSVKWRFSVGEIFVRYKSDEPAFKMKSDRICLYDFKDNYYEIDYDGNPVKQKTAAIR